MLCTAKLISLTFIHVICAVMNCNAFCFSIIFCSYLIGLIYNLCDNEIPRKLLGKYYESASKYVKNSPNIHTSSLVDDNEFENRKSEPNFESDQRPIQRHSKLLLPLYPMAKPIQPNEDGEDNTFNKERETYDNQLKNNEEDDNSNREIDNSDRENDNSDRENDNSNRGNNNYEKDDEDNKENYNHNYSEDENLNNESENQNNSGEGDVIQSDQENDNDNYNQIGIFYQPTGLFDILPPKILSIRLTF